MKFLTTTTQEEIDLSRLLPADLIKADSEAEAAAAAMGMTGIAGQEADQLKSSEIEKKKSQLPEIDSSINLEQFEEVIAENARLVKENPQQAALLIRYWLNDGKL